MSKRGRPAILPPEQTKLSDVRISLATESSLMKIAVRKGVSVSVIVREAIEAYIANDDEFQKDHELVSMIQDMKYLKTVSREMDRLIQESEARIAAFESKLRPQSPTSEHTASQEDTNQGKAQ